MTKDEQQFMKWFEPAIQEFLAGLIDVKQNEYLTTEQLLATEAQQLDTFATKVYASLTKNNKQHQNKGASMLISSFLGTNRLDKSTQTFTITLGELKAIKAAMDMDLPA